ncbi:DUF397 domain-containing protein [Streptomyces justiciae]|uniref:DUF397 domain-containing protein n=1 Tax=Streptomyces justiciae TaxID=2780140 RepID=A0ABU3LK55_9ACTN|nr:DUF397 domain-containing protein [Streptomyces justiciae]MDT7839201.1 DUF397 domain-containing protein [Streptomyces justiciae]
MSTDLHWSKSSYSDGEGECLEVASTPTTIHLRDSKSPDPHAPHLHLTPTTWTAFLKMLA